MTSIPDGTGYFPERGSNRRLPLGTFPVLVIIILAATAGQWELAAALASMAAGGPLIAISVHRHRYVRV
ncbi:hypothetical protein [Streptomyces sp. NPDC057909]|uniref:hypothetical protein n=1 Tax=Streptomyces sp. NPDC057909 TaxID=3346277 RepID=UPI0036EA765E